MKINFMYEFFEHLDVAVFYGTSMDSTFKAGTFIVDCIISTFNNYESKYLESN